MKPSLRNRLLKGLPIAIFFVLLLLLVLYANRQFFDPDQVDPLPEPLINVTRAEYEQAHSRWLAQNVQEYEIQVNYFHSGEGGNTVTLRVSDNGTIIYRKRDSAQEFYLLEDSLEAPTEFSAYEYFKRYTIEQEFIEIESLLDQPKYPIKQPNGHIAENYTTEFNAQYGYPTYLNFNLEVVDGNIPYIEGSDGAEITGFKILK